MSDGLDTVEYDFDLPNKLEGTLWAYRDAREAYWKGRVESLDSEGWSATTDLIRDADEIARLICGRAQSLQNAGSASDVNQIHQLYEAACERYRQDYVVLQQQLLDAGLSRRQVDELIRSITEPEKSGPRQADPFQLVREALWIEDAFDVVPTIPERAERRLRLERLVRDVLGKKRAPAACLRYLSLVSRCYIYGLDCECVAMCRAAMEQAFKERVTEAHLRLAGRMKDQPTLSDRIQAAVHVANRLIPPELQQPADDVRLRGDKAVHYQTDVVDDVLGTIESLLVVVDGLATSS
jgi:hypothetical protein